MSVRFRARELGADGALADCELEFDGSTEGGFEVRRNGAPHLALGPGYRVLRTLACGVCSTDLARRFLPFPLPQVTGHELVAADGDGQRYVVEINASHAARRVPEASTCAYCSQGLARHCPERLVLGIHDLPGGFGPYVLAPRGALVPVPDAVSTEVAALVEPFAAALRAVERTTPRRGEVVGVLGPRRLGLLLTAALRAWSDEHGLGLEVVALSRHEALLSRAAALGAHRGVRVEGSGDALPDGLADVVFDTTGNPAALDLAARLARREVHLKSTHGQPSSGLRHTTAMVVDELSLQAHDGTSDAAEEGAPVDVRRWTARQIGALAAENDASSTLPPRAAVAGDGQVDLVVRPRAGVERALIRPQGRIEYAPTDRPPTPLLEAVAARGLRLSTSRCGDFAAALRLLGGSPRLARLAAELIDDRTPAAGLDRALARAASKDVVKVLVTHAASDRPAGADC